MDEAYTQNEPKRVLKYPAFLSHALYYSIGLILIANILIEVAIEQLMMLEEHNLDLPLLDRF